MKNLRLPLCKDFDEGVSRWLSDQSDSRELLKQREDFLAGVSDAGRPEAVAKQRKAVG